MERGGVFSRIRGNSILHKLKPIIRTNMHPTSLFKIGSCMSRTKVNWNYHKPSPACCAFLTSMASFLCLLWHTPVTLRGKRQPSGRKNWLKIKTSWKKESCKYCQWVNAVNSISANTFIETWTHACVQMLIMIRTESKIFHSSMK